MIRLSPKRDFFGRLAAPGRVWLTPAEAPEPTPKDIRFSLQIEGDLPAHLATGDRLGFTDARGQEHELKITQTPGASCLAEIERTAFVEEGTPVSATRADAPIGVGRILGVPEVVNPIALLPGDLLVLTRTEEPGEGAERATDGRALAPAHIHCTLDAAFEQVETGQGVWFDDGKIGGIVKENDGERITVKITQTGPQGAKLRAEKGINFPDTALKMSALTDSSMASSDGWTSTS